MRPSYHTVNEVMYVCLRTTKLTRDLNRGQDLRSPAGRVIESGGCVRHKVVQRRISRDGWLLMTAGQGALGPGLQKIVPVVHALGFLPAECQVPAARSLKLLFDDFG